MERARLEENGNRVAVHILLPNSVIRTVQHQRIDWDLDTSRTIEKLLEIALALPGPSDPSTGNNDTFRNHPNSKLFKLHLPENLIKKIDHESVDLETSRGEMLAILITEAVNHLHREKHAAP